MIKISGLNKFFGHHHVLKNIDLPVDIRNWIIRPSLAGILCSLITLTINKLYLIKLFSSSVSTILAVLILGGSYTLLLFFIGCLSIKDVKSFLGSR